MAICRSYLDRKTLYRGQARDYGVIVSSAWRKIWRARQALSNDVLQLVIDYINQSIGVGEFEEGLASLAARSEDAPTFYRYLAEPAGRKALLLLASHIGESVGQKWRNDIARAELEELEGVFLIKYQSYLFNNTESVFLRRYIPRTFHELAKLVLLFYKENRQQFDVNFRIRQVVTDILGILQHYGILGTPGIDLTDDLDVALWFATHQLTKKENGTLSYEMLLPDKWGYVYEVKAPTVIYSTLTLSLPEIDDLPDYFAVNISNLSPLFLRVCRQRGWYGASCRPWSEARDLQEVFEIKRRRVVEYGNDEEIKSRLITKDINQEYIFPGVSKDPFKAFLNARGVETFM